MRRWKLSEETKHKQGLAKLGSKNPMWKDDDITYSAIHSWINRNKSKPDFCEICGIKGMLDWANKNDKYLKNIDDWIALCRKCHLHHDGIILTNLKRGDAHLDRDPKTGRYIRKSTLS